MPAAKKPTGHKLGPKFDDPDLVDRIFEFIGAQFPEMGPLLPDLKEATRAEFSGQEFYIPKRGRTDRQQQVASVLALFNGRNATAMARELGIGRATVYRVLKQAGYQAEASMVVREVFVAPAVPMPPKPPAGGGA